MKGVPAVPPEPSLSGSAMGLWCRHLVQHSQLGQLAVASSAVRVCDSFQSPSASQCLLPEDVLNEPLFFNRQVTQPPFSSPAINNSGNAAAATPLTPERKLLVLSAGITNVAHLQLACTTKAAATVVGAGVAISLVGASLSMADRCQLSTISSMIPGSHNLWQAGHSACPNSPAAHCQPLIELLPTLAEPVSSPGHILGFLQA